MNRILNAIDHSLIWGFCAGVLCNSLHNHDIHKRALSGIVLESEDPKAEMHFNVLYLENETKDKLFYPIGGKTPRPPAQQVE